MGFYEIEYLDNLVRLFGSSFIDEKSFYSPIEGKERVSSSGADRSYAGCGTPAGKASEDDRKDAAHLKSRTDRAVL